MITFPPQLRDATPEKQAVMHEARRCMGRLKMELGQLNMLTKRFVYNNGMEITCSYCYGKEDVYIKLPVTEVKKVEVVAEETLHGFLAHPRNGTVRNFRFPGHGSKREPFYGIAHTGKGYKLEVVNGQTTVVDIGDSVGVQEGIPYPLSDDRNTVYHFEIIDGKWTAAGPQRSMYGNVDWKGPKTEDPKLRRILTYKGNPSRYWPVDQFCEIPGLSSVDHFVEGIVDSYEYMTVFGDTVYSGGKALVVMPQLYHPLNSSGGTWEASHQNAQVLGAAIRESDGTLFCAVKTCYNSYPKLKAAAGNDGFLASAWHTYKNGVVYKDWLDDKAGAEKQVADSKGALTLVEVPDPGRGYFVEIIASKAGNIPGGWSRLLRIPTPSWCDVNWFFSEDGTKACAVMFGQLHTIAIDGFTATHAVESCGGFTNNVESSYVTDQENNYGEPDPEQAGGIFSNVFRVGVNDGDWIGRTDVTGKYKSTKSGSLVIAADYKANTLVKMQANLSGSETFDYFRRFGTRWGGIAMADDTDGRFNDNARRPWIIGMPAGGGNGYVHIYLQYGGACSPDVTIAGMSLDSLDKEYEYYKYPF